MLRIARTSRLLASAPAANSGSNHLPQAQRLRTSTGITGVPVHPSPLPTLVGMYQSTLKLLSALPEGSVYRQATEALTHQRLAIVEKHLDSATQSGSASKVDNADEKAIEAAEEEIDDGLIEEVINQAQHEQRLAGKMIEWKRCDPAHSKAMTSDGADPSHFPPFTTAMNLWLTPRQKGSGPTLAWRRKPAKATLTRCNSACSRCRRFSLFLPRASSHRSRNWVGTVDCDDSNANYKEVTTVMVQAPAVNLFVYCVAFPGRLDFRDWLVRVSHRGLGQLRSRLRAKRMAHLFWVLIGNVIFPAVVVCMLVLLDQLITRRRNCRNARHGDERGESQTLRPHSRLNQFLSKREGLCLNVGKR